MSDRMKLLREWLRLVRSSRTTSAAGLAVIFLGIGFLMKLITMEQFLVGFAAVTGAGLLAAKDANKS